MKKNPSVLFLLLTVALYVLTGAVYPLLAASYEEGTVALFPLLAAEQLLSAIPPFLTFGAVFAVWKTHTFGTGMFFYGFFCLADLCARMISLLIGTAEYAFEGFGAEALAALLSWLLTAALYFLILLAGRLLFFRKPAGESLRFFDLSDPAFRGLFFAGVLTLVYKWARLTADVIAFGTERVWLLTGADIGDILFEYAADILLIFAAFLAGRWMQKRFFKQTTVNE